MPSYMKVKAGEWIHPIGRTYKFMCCDCKLVHRMQFRIHQHKGANMILFRAWRDERSTSAARRKRKH